MKKESIPTQIGAVLAFMIAASAKITAAPADYGTDADGATALADLVTAATTANGDVETARLASQAKTAALDDSIFALTAGFRNLAQQARFNPDVSDEMLADIGIHRKGDPSRISAPNDAPILSIDSLTMGFADVTAKVPGQTGRSKPDGAIGVQLSLVDGTVAPELDNPDHGVMLFSSKARARVATDIGKARVRLYARWISPRGENSPWSLPSQFVPQTP